MHGLVSDDAPIKSVESRLSLRNGLDFALPYPDDAPSKSGKFGFCPEVALDIAAYLLLPELDISSWGGGSSGDLHGRAKSSR